jgi:hypothetical protein
LQYKVVEKLEEKKGSGVYRPNWQDHRARAIRETWLTKRDMTKEHTPTEAAEIRRIYLLRLLNRKPHEFVGTL